MLYAVFPPVMAAPDENKVIARYIDGRLLKGTTVDFFPTRKLFHLETSEGDLHDVHLANLKAVFFVKSFDGNPDYQERRGFFTTHTQGKKVLVEFEDGETLFGYTLSYSSLGIGFFVFPGDPESNNIKIFIVNGSTKRVKLRAHSSRYQPSKYSG
jgi:hypothetical protein